MGDMDQLSRELQCGRPLIPLAPPGTYHCIAPALVKYHLWVTSFALHLYHALVSRGVRFPLAECGGCSSAESCSMRKRKGCSKRKCPCCCEKMCAKLTPHFFGESVQHTTTGECKSV